MAASLLHGACFGEEAGARNLAFFRVIVPCKVATAGEYLVCAACAAAVVPDATWFLLVPPLCSAIE